MGLESASYLNDLDSANPVGTDSRKFGDDHIRLMKAVLKLTFPGLAGRQWRVVSKIASSAIAVTDNFTIWRLSGAGIVLTPNAVATLGNGHVMFLVGDGTNSFSIDPNGTETLNGSSATQVFDAAGTYLLYCDGTALYTFGFLTSPLFPGTGAGNLVQLDGSARLPAVDGSLLTNLPSQLIPAGSIIDYAGVAAPAGYLMCDGGEYARATYAALDAVIGTTYGAYTNGSGGAGTTHFRTPDLRGRVAVGKDNMGGSSANRVTSGGSGVTGTTLGASGGAETHALTTAQLASHTHTIAGLSGVLNTGAGSVFSYANGYSTVYTQNEPTVTGSNGSGTAHNNVQPSLILNKIIKT